MVIVAMLAFSLPAKTALPLGWVATLAVAVSYAFGAFIEGAAGFGSPDCTAATLALASASSPLSEKIIIAIVPTTMTVTSVLIICIMNRFIVCCLSFFG